MRKLLALKKLSQKNANLKSARGQRRHEFFASPAPTEILRLRQIYLKLFQRKLHAVGCTYTDYAVFRATLSKVRTFSTLLENFSNS
jgi:hypothetical protein